MPECRRQCRRAGTWKAAGIDQTEPLLTGVDITVKQREVNTSGHPGGSHQRKRTGNILFLEIFTDRFLPATDVRCPAEFRIKKRHFLFADRVKILFQFVDAPDKFTFRGGPIYIGMDIQAVDRFKQTERAKFAKQMQIDITKCRPQYNRLRLDGFYGISRVCVPLHEVTP